jgi:hypothetical protein
LSTRINKTFSVFLRVLTEHSQANRHNGIAEERCVARSTFGHTKKTLNSINQAKDRNQALSHVNFLFGALRKFITRRRPDRNMGIIEEEPQLISGDNPLKVFVFCSVSAIRRSSDYDTLSLFSLIDRECGFQ